MNQTLRTLYETHHASARGEGFSILKEDRGRLFARLVGSGRRVLDIGCRDGALTAFFSEGNTVLGADIDEVALGRAREALGIETVSMDLNGDWHELSGRAFDAVVAGEILEHLYYPEAVTQRAAVVLSANGVFVGSVPNAFSLKNRFRLLLGRKRHTPLADPTHINHFSRAELRDMLARHFKEVTIHPLGTYARLDRMAPGMFAFDLAFCARYPVRP